MFIPGTCLTPVSEGKYHLRSIYNGCRKWVLGIEMNRITCSKGPASSSRTRASSAERGPASCSRMAGLDSE